MTDVSTARQLSATKQALLAQRLRGRGGGDDRPRPAGVAPPLSFAQERLWFMEQLVPGSAAHTIPVALRLRGALDAGALELALGDVADRHEALRMRYPAGEDGRPEVLVCEPDGLRLPLRAASAGSADAAQDLVDGAIAEPFDLATGPVARAALVRLADDDHVLALAVHHIACDGWSADILLADLFAFYQARRAGRPSGLAALPVQYGDYAIRQRDGLTGAADGDFAYWKRRLAALPTLDLVDRPAAPGRADLRRDGARLPPRPGPDPVRARPRPAARRDPVHGAAGRVPGAARALRRAARLRRRLPGRGPPAAGT